MVITRASHARGHEFDPRLEYSFFVFGFLVLFGTTPERKNKITTHTPHTHVHKKKILHPVRFELTPSNEDQNLSLAP